MMIAATLRRSDCMSDFPLLFPAPVTLQIDYHDLQILPQARVEFMGSGFFFRILVNRIQIEKVFGESEKRIPTPSFRVVHAGDSQNFAQRRHSDLAEL